MKRFGMTVVQLVSHLIEHGYPADFARTYARNWHESFINTRLPAPGLLKRLP